ncbi:hypothetical protein SGPA1_30701 [Streptomyces misionensis JCM 4497]
MLPTSSRYGSNRSTASTSSSGCEGMGHIIHCSVVQPPDVSGTMRQWLLPEALSPGDVCDGVVAMDAF